MDTTNYLIFGLLLVLTSIAITWARQSRMVGPASFFFAAYFLHAFVAPVVKVYLEQAYPYANQNELFLYNLYCGMAALGGYLLIIAASQFHRTEPNATRLLMDPKGYNLFAITFIMICALAFILMLQSGAFSEGRAFASGYGQGPILFRIAKYLISASLLPVILCTCYLAMRYRELTVSHRLLFATPLILIFAIDIGTYGRKAGLYITISVIIFYICRVSALSKNKYLFAILLFLIISFIGSLRSLGIGITDLNLDSIQWAYEHGKIGFVRSITFLTSTLPGQDVASNVLMIVNAHNDLMFGSTYLNSFLSNTTFGLLPAGGYEVPSIWYAKTMGLLGSYGRDFSMIAESYMNFGQYGFLFFALVGVFIGWAETRLSATANLLMAVWCSSMFANLIAGLRNDSTPLFTRALFAIIPIIIFIFIYNTFLKKKRNSSVESRSKQKIDNF